MVEEKKKQQGAIFLCWIVLFDLECSERRALCNVFSTHMADCVTTKHTRGGACFGKVGEADRQEERDRAMEDSSKWTWEEKHCCSYWCWVTFLIKAAQSSSCNSGPNKPHNETWECPLVMVQTFICCSVPKTHCLSKHPFPPVVRRGNLNNYTGSWSCRKKYSLCLTRNIRPSFLCPNWKQFIILKGQQNSRHVMCSRWPSKSIIHKSINNI